MTRPASSVAGAKLREWRERNGLTQLAASLHLGIAQPALSLVEAGAAMPRAAVAQILAVVPELALPDFYAPADGNAPSPHDGQHPQGGPVLAAHAMREIRGAVEVGSLSAVEDGARTWVTPHELRALLFDLGYNARDVIPAWRAAGWVARTSAGEKREALNRMKLAGTPAPIALIFDRA
jgi:transcriptional regulator with XRE-family HTH domain